MSLLLLQRTMRETILADDDPSGQLSPGIAIYRNAYRARLLAALQVSYERTRQWAGEEVFDAAACHHIILNPPVSWTLDDYGAGFDQTLVQLFAQDPEVGELAWLEWHMSLAFAAPDQAVLDPGALLSGPLADGNWDDMRLTLVRSFAMRTISTACTALWLSLRDGDTPVPDRIRLLEPTTLIVWRNGLSPHFRLLTDPEATTLAAIASGTPFGEVCAKLAEAGGPEAAVAQIGAWLGRWLQDGLLSCPVEPDAIAA